MKGSGKVNIPILEILLENGADINATKSASGWNTRGSNSQTGFSKVIELVLGGSVDNSLLSLALKYGGDPNKSFRKSGSSMRTDSSTNYYLIHEIITKNRHDILKILIDNGLDVNSLYSYDMNNEYGSRQIQKKHLCIC